jgi:hypothetical protein
MSLSENSIKGGNPETSYKEKEYEITYNDGRTEVIKNLNKMCKERKYSRSALYSMIVGNQNAHKDIVKIIRKESQEVI